MLSDLILPDFHNQLLPAPLERFLPGRKIHVQPIGTLNGAADILDHTLAITGDFYDRSIRIIAGVRGNGAMLGLGAAGVSPTIFRLPLFDPLATYARQKNIQPRRQLVLILSDE